MADDFLTVAKALRPLAKTVTPSEVTPGRVVIHDFPKAKSNKFAERAVSCIHTLSEQLGRLHDGDQRLCVVRGRFVGKEAAVVKLRDGAEAPAEGYYQRIKENLPDVPHHWICIDVDGYSVPGLDPVAQFHEAVQHYIENVLPPCFHGVTYHWQRSSSAGLVREHPVKEKAEAGVRCLKAHLWFWLSRAYLSSELALWAEPFGNLIDKSVLQATQAHYTANPVFEGGVADPIPVRWGLEQGFEDTVGLQIDVRTLEAAQAKLQERLAGQSNLKDPSEKPGIIGAFHRAIDVEALVDELLPEHLEWQDGSNHRLTWLGGGGSPGGAFVTTDRMHIGAVHNTWPFGQERAANLFDVLRVLKFGELDAGMDDFELLDPAAAPSYQAAVQFIGELPAVREVLTAEKTAERASLEEVISSMTDPAEIESRVLPEIAGKELSPIEEAKLVAALVSKCRDMGHKEIGKAEVKAALRKGLKDARAEEIGHVMDIELALAKLVLDDHFAKGAHLKRFGGVWWMYHKGVWRPTEDDFIGHKAQATLEKVKRAGGENAKKMNALLAEAGRGDYLNSLATSVIGVLKRKACAEDAQSDPLNLLGHASHSVINCRNGELWFDDDGSVAFLDHDPEHRLTSMVATDYIEGADCPRFKAALRRVFSRCKEPEEMIRHWCEVMGTIIQPQRPEALWVLMRGPGGNGKTFLVEVVEALLGRGACLKGSIADLSTGRDNHFTASLVGKMMFFDDDVKAGAVLPDDWLKKLSEEKVLSANPKNAQVFEFKSRAVAVILANFWPHTSDTSHGLKRRAHVFEMNYVIPPSERRPGEKDRIINEELPGVLNLLIAGWRRVLQRGGYQRPLEAVMSADRWIRNGNTTERFVGSMLVRDDRTPALSALVVYDAYKQWMAEREPNAKVMGRNTFYLALENSGIPLRRRHQQMVVTGVSLRLDAGDDHELEELDATISDAELEESTRLAKETISKMVTGEFDD